MDTFEWVFAEHCVKIVQIRSFFLSIFSCIQSKYWKIQTRKNSVFGHFSRSGSSHHRFNFENMRYVAEVLFFPIKFYRKIYFHEKFVTVFCYSCFTLHMFHWMNKFSFRENNFLACLIKKETYRSSLYFPKCFCIENT